ncbi:MAG: hypothetical protein IJ091_07730 [Oscillospiraceae bacterium]|nr:hypothetical protein [Oscillospiraceae bacterium]
MEWCIAEALLILLGTAVYAHKRKNDMKAMSLSLTAGISIAAAVLTAPYFALSYKDPFMIGLKSFRYGAGLVSLSVEPGIVSALGLTGAVKTVYTVLLYIIYLLEPICASLFAVSFSRSVSEWIRFRGHKKVHVFSQLNSKTVAIAESLAESRPDEMPVFCNDEGSGNEDLRMRARAAHALLLKRNEASLHIRKGREYEFYIIEPDTRKVLTDTAKLCGELVKKKYYDRSRVFVRFSASPDCQNMTRDIDRVYGKQVRLRPVDEHDSEAICLLRSYCTELSVPGEHRVVIVGGGAAGAAMLRQAVCVMTGPETASSFVYISKNAAAEASHLKASSPGILEKPLSSYTGAGTSDGDYPIHFYNTDPESADLFDILSSLGEPSLICVTSDDDEMNYDLAQRIKRFFASRKEDLSYPPIACRITDKKLNEMLGSDTGVRLFGNEADRYDYDSLIDPELEEEAKRVHLSYLLATTPNALDVTGSEREKLLEDSDFYGYVNMQSSMASALALVYRRAYILSKKSEEDERPDEEFVREWLEDPGKLKVLGDAEHMRWNAFQKYQGWRKADRDQTKTIAKSTSGRRIRSDEFLLHPALVPLEELPDVEKTTDEIKLNVDPNGNATGFIESDRLILRNLPVILNK